MIFDTGMGKCTGLMDRTIKDTGIMGSKREKGNSGFKTGQSKLGFSKVMSIWGQQSRNCL